MDGGGSLLCAGRDRDRSRVPEARRDRVRVGDGLPPRSDNVSWVGLESPGVRGPVKAKSWAVVPEEPCRGSLLPSKPPTSKKETLCPVAVEGAVSEGFRKASALSCGLGGLSLVLAGDMR
jgi:hypothetical protein